MLYLTGKHLSLQQEENATISISSQQDLSSSPEKNEQIKETKIDQHQHQHHSNGNQLDF